MKRGQYPKNGASVEMVENKTGGRMHYAGGRNAIENVGPSMRRAVIKRLGLLGRPFDLYFPSGPPNFFWKMSPLFHVGRVGALATRSPMMNSSFASRSCDGQSKGNVI